MPCTSKVGIAQMRFITSSGSLRAQGAEAVVLLEPRHAEAAAFEVLELLARGRRHVVVEARDLDAAGARVEASRPRAGRARRPDCAPRRRRCRSAGRWPRSRRVKGKPCRPRSPAGDAGWPRETQTVSETTTESVRAAVLLVSRVAREVRGADLLLELPEEVDVHGHAGFERGLRRRARSAPGPCRRWCRARSSGRPAS